MIFCAKKVKLFVEKKIMKKGSHRNNFRCINTKQIQALYCNFYKWYFFIYWQLWLGSVWEDWEPTRPVLVPYTVGPGDCQAGRYDVVVVYQCTISNVKWSHWGYWSTYVKQGSHCVKMLETHPFLHGTYQMVCVF